MLQREEGEEEKQLLLLVLTLFDSFHQFLILPFPLDQGTLEMMEATLSITTTMILTMMKRKRRERTMMATIS